MIQRTVANFLSLGHYDALLARTARAYAERRLAMVAALGLPITPGGGSSLWLRRAGADMAAVAQALRDDSVLIEPGGPFFAGGAGRDWYRLAWSTIPAARVADGIALLRAAAANGRSA